jgi:two-component system, chemotaxis family, protein-glutamate methylesterase/glutaminase
MERSELDRAGRDFPIVCVGGSAGGLDAYIRLLQNLPNDMGVAIVIVIHRRAAQRPSSRLQMQR